MANGVHHKVIETYSNEVALVEAVYDVSGGDSGVATEKVDLLTFSSKHIILAAGYAVLTAFTGDDTAVLDIGVVDSENTEVDADCLVDGKAKTALDELTDAGPAAALGVMIPANGKIQAAITVEDLTAGKLKVWALVKKVS